MGQVLRMLKESLLATWWPRASGKWKKDEWVKVEAFKGRRILVPEDSKEYTPVLVQVTAASRAQGTAVDVVAVLDISRSMKGEKMEQMKVAMQVVINNLGSKNRLSLVLFNDKVHRPAMRLREMDKAGRDAAMKVVNDLSTIASHEYCNDSGTAALSTAVEVLIERKEGDSRLGCIILLSGGEDKVISTTKIPELKYPVHTFGLGADHDARPLSCIADKSAGTYSFINSCTKNAFKVFIDGLTSVAATSVNVRLKPHAGVTISSIVKGGYKQDVKEEESSCHEIHIADMCAGERKNFMVYLTLSDQEGATVEKLLTVDGDYQLKHSNNQQCFLRPKDLTTTIIDSSLGSVQESEVTTELLRLKLVKGVMAMAEQDAHPAADELRRGWKDMVESTECKGADSTAVSHLGKDVDEMVKKPGGRSYMLSWLSCHKWQRVTTMAHYPCGFGARAATSPRESRLPAFLRGPWCLFGAVFLLALLAMLLGLYFSNTPTILRVAHLDVMQHPSWPAMAKDLDVMIDRTKQGEITSFFVDNNASSSEMSHQIDQYLYKAILFAAVLSDRYRDSDVYRASLRDTAHCKKAVRHKVVKYLQAIVKMTEGDALPCMKDLFDKNEMAVEMNRYLYSAMVQTNVLVTIHTPPDVIIDDEKDQRIHDQCNKIAILEKNITQLQADKASCCQKADARAQKLEELGSSVHDVDDAWEQKLKELP
ncbi:unnamed protein product [Urochloa decumbens]|uniref:VWFA domain-containing protein n=1 Tax=Urochloa decumbens TaxID=240449 RepID=A0ABC9B642_9POAL